MRLIDQLLLVATRYAEVTGQPEWRVSTQVWGSGNRLSGLRKGKDMLSRNVEDGLGWFSEHWPEGQAWPCEVPRPAPLPSGAGSASRQAAPPA